MSLARGVLLYRNGRRECLIVLNRPPAGLIRLAADDAIWRKGNFPPVAVSPSEGRRGFPPLAGLFLCAGVHPDIAKVCFGPLQSGSTAGRMGGLLYPLLPPYLTSYERPTVR